MHGSELTTGQHRLNGPPQTLGPVDRNNGQEGRADSPWQAAGRPPGRAGYVAGRAHHSRSQGGCTHTGKGVALHLPATPAQHSAGYSASLNTPWSPGHCRTCCQLGREEKSTAQSRHLQTSPPQHVTQVPGNANVGQLVHVFSSVKQDLIAFPDHKHNKCASFQTITYTEAIIAPPGNGPGSPYPILPDTCW